MTLRARFPRPDEAVAIDRLARPRTAPARAVERARMALRSRRGDGVAKIAEQLVVCEATGRR